MQGRVVFGVMAITCILAAQGPPAGDPWDEVAARADLVMECTARDEGHSNNPAGAARDLYAQAILLVDASSTKDPERRGAFRALAVKKMEELTAKRDLWNQAYERSAKFLAKQALYQARGALTAVEPIPCWDAAQAMMARINKELADAENRLEDGDSILLRAQSSFNSSQAKRLYADAMASYTKGRQMNTDDQRFVERLLAARRGLEAITSPAKNEILLLSNPGGAHAILKGDGPERECPSTPCKWSFDPAYMRRSGGNFVNSKRLTAPLVAEVERPGYKSLTVPLSEGPSTLVFSVPGRKVQIQYYYIAKTRFEVQLQPSAPELK